MGVLIVDDSDFMRLSIKKILDENNIRVAGEAKDGVEAVIKYKQLKPSLVTMDLTMPEMEGENAISEILKYDPNAKIIVCSAMGQETRVMRAIKAGAKTFIVKPLDPQRLLDEIERIGKEQLA
ncbi:two-component system chemotaxis response regulator CheY [Clostridium tetanomorphum]|uniref:Stage 0 sporulation protein A homolog n=2 Tax=Clostridium tetanomorphum TaxID=1553 RepID=A0A923ECC8_CLOTT|nr:response regulator [Clostridium tetanomorphum]KAJ51278.1 response regulator receiver protein [Clostridium tetanomorphum DSM 665]KAJ52345.1 response regulator receiver protein [Clostridium tetanomorphum DSM 665]MBC2397865.1 response regulator [Clostridium tetanomorphum]MBP1864820.1 two-component system chemotaxis response regulator CheY [Clostridium tetanomorphum]NRS83996.1 two-component system chemotaxis response regulator CheY [Clostridium tetanomorphum]